MCNCILHIYVKRSAAKLIAADLPFILQFVARSHVLRLALQEALQGDLSLETHLGFHADIHQNTAILVPLADAIQITGAAFIVDDKGRDLVPEAFLEHQQASNAAIAICEGTDALEPNMELKNLMEADVLLSFILFE